MTDAEAIVVAAWFDKAERDLASAWFNPSIAHQIQQVKKSRPISRLFFSIALLSASV